MWSVVRWRGRAEQRVVGGVRSGRDDADSLQFLDLRFRGGGVCKVPLRGLI
jgi:hypothetical protein